ncbi:MAG: zinc-dependent metalloprotease, partial [Terriglobia bacterium]
MTMRKPLTGMILAALVASLTLAVLPATADRPATAQDETETAADSIFFTPRKASTEEKKKDGPPKDKEKPFEEVVKKMEKIEGLFTFYRDKEDGKVLLEVPPEWVDKDFIVSAKIEQATGERGLYGTIMAGEAVYQWRRLGKRVQLVEKNIRFRAAEGSPAAGAIEKSFTDSVLASAKRASKPHPESKSVLASLNDLLLAKDLHGIAQFLNRAYRGRYQLNKKDSAFALVKSFPENAELGAVLNFQSAAVKRSSVTIPDPRSLNVTLRYSLLAVPESDYRPRLADDRVGYFMDQHMDFTSDKPATPYVRFITRWHLKKKNPNARVSEPVEPIVFWLENTMPEEYREAFAAGALLWNKAFEKAGFKDALVVKQQPEDAEWDPADIRYNTIRWFVGYDASFAIGPSHTNPYTGQIIDADIGMSEGIVRFGARRRYRYYVDPVQRLREMKADPLERPWLGGRPDPRFLCRYGDELAEMASFAYDLMSTRPDWDAEKEKEFIRQYIIELTAHEVGHTLGLRHNFRASLINRSDQLGDTSRTHEVGLAASVMDYNPPIVALEGERQGDYLPQVVGSYDQWAIQYGYRPLPGAKSPEDELPELRKIASQGADWLHPYGTDEDAGLSPRALDPRNTRYDFTSEPLDWFRHEYKLVKEMWTNIDSKILQPGDSYVLARTAFGYTWGPYFLGAHVAMKHIGGIEHNRDHVGDPG